MFKDSASHAHNMILKITFLQHFHTSIYCQQAIALDLYITSLSNLSATGDTSGGSGDWKRETGRSEIFNQPTLNRLLSVFFIFGWRRRGVALCANTVCLFQFSCLLSSRIITHPLLVSALGLKQPFPCHCQPTWWIKTTANPRLLLSSPLLISLALILKQLSSLLNEPLQEDEHSL